MLLINSESLKHHSCTVHVRFRRTITAAMETDNKLGLDEHYKGKCICVKSAGFHCWCKSFSDKDFDGK